MGYTLCSAQIDVNATTLADFVSKVLKRRLGFTSPSVMLSDGNILYEEGEGADESLELNLPLALSACPAGGIQDRSLVSVEDFTQELKVRVCVSSPMIGSMHLT